MNGVQIEQKSYEMPPRDGFTVTVSSPSPTSTDRLIFMKRSSAAVSRGPIKGGLHEAGHARPD